MCFLDRAASNFWQDEFITHIISDRIEISQFQGKHLDILTQTIFYDKIENMSSVAARWIFKVYGNCEQFNCIHAKKKIISS